MSTAIFIFTRDLRSTDNTGLDYCIKNFEKVIPVFFLTETQINKKKNKYFSENGFSFLKSAIGILQKDVSLNVIKTQDLGQKCLIELFKKYKIDTVVISKDYTPFAKKRENIYLDLCNENNINFLSFHDHLLLDKIIFTPKGTPYKKFTPFYTKALEIKPRKVSQIDQVGSNKLVKIKGSSEPIFSVLEINYDFDKAKNYIKDYLNNRETVSKESTKLSRYIKFGIYSIRTIYDKFKFNKEFVRSLLWREFYYNYYHDDSLSLVNGDMNIEKIKWSSNKKLLKKWEIGMTGFPLVDAGMRELNAIGFMQNRARLIVASFLTKNLMISWKKGERYFASKLYDYDPIVNAGNWQNVSSVAKHSSPWFRVMSPWIQSKKFDKNCEYIKKWIPELSSIPNIDIHNWNTSCPKYSDINYPKPIVDFSETKQIYFSYFKK